MNLQNIAIHRPMNVYCFWIKHYLRFNFYFLDLSVTWGTPWSQTRCINWDGSQGFHGKKALEGQVRVSFAVLLCHTIAQIMDLFYSLKIWIPNYNKITFLAQRPYLIFNINVGALTALYRHINNFTNSSY